MRSEPNLDLAAQPAVADGRPRWSLRSLSHPPLNGSSVGQPGGAMFRRVGMGVGLFLFLTPSCDDGKDCGQEVHARPYDVGRSCFAQPERAGCISKGSSCPPSIKFAVDKAGRCLAFPDCLPEGLVQAGPGVNCPPPDGYRECGSTMAALPNQSLPGGRSHRSPPLPRLFAAERQVVGQRGHAELPGVDEPNGLVGAQRRTAVTLLVTDNWPGGSAGYALECRSGVGRR